MAMDLFDTKPVWRTTPGTAPDIPTKTIESCESFGWLINERERAAMLEFRQVTGEIMALPYSLLESATFNPSIGITLSFSGTTVQIVGTNLNTEVLAGVRMFEAITRQRVVWITENADSHNDQPDCVEPTIDEICIRS